MANKTANKTANLEDIITAGEGATRLTASAVVRELLGVLGSSTVAAIAGVNNPRSIYYWLNGEREPDRLDTLRFALQLVYMMRRAGELDDTIDAWFTTINARLNDSTPAAQLSGSTASDVAGPILSAARSFLGIQKAKFKQA